ncbi:hypothetical protein [Nonomuraea sp. NPDC049129]|uniref:hypothetical protein n=1 Tax=Nonomuraea sp. NPDC049129 TaxID=3155272 RepID=UPI0033F97E4F
MDTSEFAASFQRLMDEQSKPSTPDPQQDVLLVSAPPEPEPDPFFDRYFVPENRTADLPTYTPEPEDPYGVFDDHLLDETEETKDVAVTNPANAKYRATRTGYQGLIASVLIAVGGVLASLTVGAAIDWRLLGLSVGQAVLTAVVSYLHNDKSAETSE